MYIYTYKYLYDNIMIMQHFYFVFAAALLHKVDLVITSDGLSDRPSQL